MGWSGWSHGAPHAWVDRPGRSHGRSGPRHRAAYHSTNPFMGRELAGMSADMNERDQWRELGQQLRVDSIRASSAAGSGHPTSSMSAADLMAVLLDGHLRLDYQNPGNPANDHLVFSKGHASPLYYSILKAAGAIDDEEFLT